MESITTATTELKQLQPLLENSWKETLNSVVKQQVYPCNYISYTCKKVYSIETYYSITVVYSRAWLLGIWCLLLSLQ